MSAEFKGIDLNCEAVPIDVNQDAGFDESSMNRTRICGLSDLGGFSTDGAKVSGEVSYSVQSGELVDEELNSRMDDGVYRDDTTEVEIEDVGNAVVVDIDRTKGTRASVFPMNSYKEPPIGLVVDLNLCHAGGVSNAGAGSVEADLQPTTGSAGSTDAPINDSGCSTNSPTKEITTNGLSYDESEMNVIHHALIPKKRGEDHQTEKEGDFCASDLVWGKVRSRPWLPGQIIEPSAASQKAAKYFKNDSCLIAYFGDQTFTWTEASKIKPFRMYFSQMKNQSNVEPFCHAVDAALDEVSRRVEFGLACQCLPQDVSSKVKSQVLINAGVQEKSSVVYGGDSFSSAASFFPEKFISYLKALAVSPRSDCDILEFVSARAQLLAFNRWKGYYELPALEELEGILGNDPDLHLSRGEENLDDMIIGDVDSKEGKLAAYGKGKSTSHSSSRKRKSKGKKEKLLVDLINGSSANFPNGESKFAGKSISEESVSFRKKRKVVGFASSEPKGKSGRAVVEDGRQFVKTSNSGASTLTSERSHMAPQEYPPISEILSKLCVAAANPIEGYGSLTSIAGVLCHFRNSVSPKYNICNEKTVPEGKLEAEKFPNSETTGAFEVAGIEDSYWTDRIIEPNMDKLLIFKPEATAETHIDVSGKDGLEDRIVNLDDKRGINATVTELGEENPLPSENENSDEHSPTALILNFSDLESIPSITNLNKIFCRYGPLEESQTDVLRASKRAKVVFKRRSDAETAFSSSGKFSTFGPSLVSYRLNYRPPPLKPSSTSRIKRSRTNTASVEVSLK